MLKDSFPFSLASPGTILQLFPGNQILFGPHLECVTRLLACLKQLQCQLQCRAGARENFSDFFSLLNNGENSFILSTDTGIDISNYSAVTGGRDQIHVHVFLHQSPLNFN